MDVEFSLDFFSAEFGRFVVTGCDGVSPTLILEAGKEYTFRQSDISNWYHPLGFAYYPDGALVGATELEPSAVKQGNNDVCVATAACDSPHYYIGDTYLGGDDGDGGFGLDKYEPIFALPIDRWYHNRSAIPDYNVRLTVDQEDTHEAFYFCHIHAGMSGRIRFCDRASHDAECVVRTGGTDEELSPYSAPAEFDVKCGTSGMQRFADDEDGYCERSNFLCAADGASETDTVAQCYQAIDCAMATDMRVTYGGAGDEFPTFLRQMIPHHQNAVNMGKIMLKHAGEDNAGCNFGDDEEFDNLMRSVINGQNAQIQYMHDYLAGAGEASVVDAQCAPVTGRDSFVRGAPATDPDDLLRNRPCELLPSGDASFTTVYVSMDYYASEFGYFKFATDSVTCSGSVPNLILAANHEYRFVQQDITNWYHPLGFAYFPDGAIADAEELEPAVDPSGSGCTVDEQCQSPEYYIGDAFLGGEDGDGGFGLDAYEPTFSLPIELWYDGNQSAIPMYNVHLTVTDSLTPEVFYFCHIHGGMGGRISVCNLADGVCSVRPDVTAADDGYITDTPVELAAHYVPSEFDQTCGSSNLDTYEPGDGYNAHCDGQVFLCTDDDTYDNYAACYDGVDCQMHHEMKVREGDHAARREQLMGLMVVRRCFDYACCCRRHC